jgi:hypothetical protein
MIGHDAGIENAWQQTAAAERMDKQHRLSQLY